MTAYSPITTPGIMMLPVPMLAPLPIMTPSQIQSASLNLFPCSSTALGFLSFIILTPGPIKTPLPILAG